MFGKLVRKQPAAHDRIERWQTPDGDHLSIARMGRIREGVPHLLILHGLEGTVRSNYAQGMLQLARARGWSGDLMLFRGCDGELNAQRRMYHSGETTDIGFVVQQLLAAHPAIDLRLVGVSLGGNVMLKWLGEQHDALPSNVTRAAAVSAPFDLAAGSRFLERGFSRLYVRHFMKSLKAKTRAKLERFPDLCDVEAMERAVTFWEFDDAVTGPVHGFRDAEDYYTQSSSIHFLDRVRVPTLLLNAVDDPFLPPSALERVERIARGRPELRVEFTPKGGHVGWVAGSPTDPIYWMEGRIICWLDDGL